MGTRREATARQGRDGEYHGNDSAPNRRVPAIPDRRPTARHYVLGSALTAAFMAGVLFLIRSAANLVVVVSLASTAFIVFARPGTVTAGVRNVVGGHLLSTAVGALCWVFATKVWPGSPTAEMLLGALAVGAATLVMTVTDTEHAPAAGTALAMVFSSDKLHLAAAAVAIGSVSLALAGLVLRKRLRDLT